jgi:hypothetical protein
MPSKANKWMGDLSIILGIKGERALVLILNYYMKVKAKVESIIIN